MELGPAIPALPVRDVAAAVAAYRDRLGFEVRHQDAGFAVVTRDATELHLWQADDESWRERASLERPVRSGAESFLAGTASCQIPVDDLDGLWAQLRERDVLHPASRDGVRETHPGRHEVAALDPDGNLLGFFTWR